MNLHSDSRQGRNEMLDESMNVTVGVVERHRRYAQYVRLAPVAHSSTLNQPAANGTAAFDVFGWRAALRGVQARAG